MRVYRAQRLKHRRTTVAAGLSGINAGPGPYREFWLLLEKAQMLFGDDVNSYLADVDRTARASYVSTKRMGKAPAAGDTDGINKNAELLNRLSITLLGQRAEVFRPYLSLDSAQSAQRNR